MKKVLTVIISIFFILMGAVVSAHQPRIVTSDFTLIENPEVSQAFYGKLRGKPDYYQIQTGQAIKLYVGILVPDIEDIGKDVSVEISKEKEFYYLLDGLNFEWQAYYEEFAGDDYFKGPELSSEEESGLPKGIEVEAGNYTLKVFSSDNQGSYVLVVGEREEFPPKEIINTLVSLPRLKKFFNKSPLQALTAPIVLRFLILPIILLIALILIIFFLVRDRKKITKLQ